MHYSHKINKEIPYKMYWTAMYSVLLSLSYIVKFCFVQRTQRSNGSF